MTQHTEFLPIAQKNRFSKYFDAWHVLTPNIQDAMKGAEGSEADGIWQLWQDIREGLLLLQNPALTVLKRQTVPNADSASELLEALRNAAQVFTNLLKADPDSPNNWKWHLDYTLAAIAKAEGR